MLWLSGARIAPTVMTLIALLHFQPNIFVKKDMGHIPAIGFVLMVNTKKVNNNKNVTIIASVLTLGVSGAVCNFGVVSIGTTALAMIVGVVLNLVLRDPKHKVNVNQVKIRKVTPIPVGDNNDNSRS